MNTATTATIDYIIDAAMRYESRMACAFRLALGLPLPPLRLPAHTIVSTDALDLIECMANRESPLDGRT